MNQILKMRNIVIILCLYLELSTCIEWNYSTVEKTGKYCPRKDSCSTDRDARGPREVDWKKRNCFCDPECGLYGDCCIDAPVFNPSEQRRNKNRFGCMELRQYGNIYVRMECDRDWKDKEIQKKCLHNEEGDPFGSTLVTSKTSGVTYRNYYCAVCNTDSLNIRMWTRRLECPTIQGFQKRFQNITREYLYDNLKQNPNSGKWGVELDTIGIPVFHDCFLDPYLPDEISTLMRKCNPGDPETKVTSSCPADYQGPPPGVKLALDDIGVDLELIVDVEEVDDLGREVEEEQMILVEEDNDVIWSRDEIIQLCESYTAVMFSSKRTMTYKNPHCALCHGEDPAEDLICLDLAVLARTSTGFMARFNPVSFAVLFDIDRSDGHEVGVLESQTCGEQELWDPFFKKCRNIVCGEEGKVFQNGVCYNEGEVPTTTTTTTSTTTTSTTTTTSSTTTTTTTTTTSTTTTSTSTTTKGISTTHTSFVRFPEDDESEPFDSINFPDKDSAPSVNVPKSTTSTTSTTTSTTSTTTTTTTTTTRRTTTYSAVSTTTTMFTTFRTSMVMNEINDSVEFYPLLSSCTRIELNKKEFRFVSGRVIIDEYNLKLEPGQFAFQGEDLVICAPEELTNKFSPIMGYVTFICLGLSMVCLVFHLLVTLIAPELQNLSGKNLFSFAFALLGSYGCFLANMLAVDIEYELCFVLAIFMYYFYLASFCWMLNIASNVAKTLRLATSQLRFTSGAQWGRFAVNCIIGWLLPAVLVIGVAVMDRLDIPEIPFQFKPGFGSSQIGLCWFSSRTALLIYFVAPFSVIMLMNFVFFTSSSCVVWESSRSTAKITATGPRISFFLYLRLALLMGLTWISGLVAGLVDLEPVWYVFLVLNTLQGLFILLFFTCSKKVVASVKERLSPASSDTDSSLWKWKMQDNQSGIGSGATSDSADSNLSTSGLSKHRSAYEQYHKYDQRFYSP